MGRANTKKNTIPHKIKNILFAPFRAVKKFIFHDLKKVFMNYSSHDGELSTCAVAFFLLISFIPTSLVIISLLSFFFESQDMASFYLNQIKSQLPSININELIGIIDRIVYQKRYLAFIWIPFLFWWGSLVFDIIERALEKAFRIEKSRKYWKAKIRHFIIILGMGLFIVVITISSNVLVIIKNSEIANFIRGNLNNLYFPKDILSRIVGIPLIITSLTTLFMNTLLIFIIYRYVPPKKLDNKSIFKGALFASMSYEIIKTLFSFYITEINDYSSIFGSLSTIVILMIWIWYTCFIFVIGAEMAWVFFENRVRARELDFSE